MKLSRDFLGAVNRLRAKATEFDDRVDEVMSHWRDSIGEEFKNQQLAPVTETLRRLMLTLHEAADTASQCDRAVREEETY